MAIFKIFALTLAVIVAISLVQEGLTQDVDDDFHTLGAQCSVTGNCNPSLCAKPSQICCEGYRFALTGRGGTKPQLTAYDSGYCVCCTGECHTSKSHGLAQTNHVFAHTDAFIQTCRSGH